MKALVCGGRDYADQEHVNEVLSSFEDAKGQHITEVIHGGARGADTCAAWWAKLHGIPARVFFAKWSEHGRAAGPIRNKQMLDEGKPDVVIAFPGGRGTENMITQAQKAGVTVVRISA